MILVVGATGTVGSEVVRQLRDRDVAVRALVRSPEKAGDVRAAGAEAVVGDLARPETLAPALADVDKAFIVLSASPDQVELETNFVDAVAAADGIAIVKLSVVGADPEAPVRFGAQHGTVERVLADSGVPHTLLRPTDFMQNSFNWAGMIQGDGRVYTPNADAPIASIDVRDIAAVAVVALTEDGHEGKIYTLTGPEALTREEQVGRVASAIGRDVEVVGVTNEQARDSMLEMGYPEYAVGGLYELMTLIYEPGYAAALAGGVAEATGRPPRSWDDFSRDHAAAWSG